MENINDREILATAFDDEENRELSTDDLYGDEEIKAELAVEEEADKPKEDDEEEDEDEDEEEEEWVEEKDVEETPA